jgi:transposase
MSDLMLLSEAQMRRIKPYFPLSHGLPRVDDRLILSGIIFVLRNGMRWRDAPESMVRTRRSIIASSAGAGSANRILLD